MDPPVRSRSIVWRYFEVLQTDKCKVRCLLCQAIISRGGVGKSAGTSCMRNHMRWKHADIFSAALKSVGGQRMVICGSEDWLNQFSETKESIGEGQDGAEEQETQGLYKIKPDTNYLHPATNSKCVYADIRIRRYGY